MAQAQALSNHIYTSKALTLMMTTMQTQSKGAGKIDREFVEFVIKVKCMRGYFHGYSDILSISS